MPKHCSGPFVAAPIVTEPEEAAVDLATAQSAGQLTKAVVTDLFSAHDFESFTFGEDATFDDDAQNAFCTAIGRCMTVSALSLRNVTPATARFDVPAFITAAVVENLSIQRLDLTNSGLTATDAKMIADLVLPWNRTVVEWDFSGNPLEDAGVTALVSAMESGSSSIQRLSFRACGVTTPDAISSAIRAFDKMPCLYQVDISGNAGLTAKAQPLLEDLDRTLERNLRLLHPGDDIAAKSLWTPELEAALNQQESEQNTPAASPGGAANQNQSSSTMDRRRSFHNNNNNTGGGQTNGASGSAAASNAGSFQGRPRSATLGASPRSRQRGQSMRQGGAPPPYLPRKSSPASRGPGTAASPARAASSGNDANNTAREETSNQSHGVDRASRHKAIPAGLEGVSHTESESETPGTAASRSESTGDAAPADSEPAAKKPTTKKAKPPPRKAPSPAPQQQRRASPAPGPRRAPSPANTPRRGQSPAGSMSGSAGGRRWAPSGRPESPMRQDDISEGVEEWRRRRNEYNGFIRSPRAGPKLSAEEEAKQHRARVQKLEPKFAFGQRLDRVRQSTSAVFRPKVTPEVREPTPRERRLLAPWNQPNNGRAQSPAGGGSDAAFRDPNDMQHSHTFGLREMDKQVTTVGQVHKVSADALSSRTGTPNGRSRSPAAGSRGGQPMIRLVDGGVTSYVADDPRDIGHIARKHESGNARADGKLFASNTPREVRWGVDSKASSYVSTKAQAPGPGFYTVPDEWDARARKLREKARNTSGTNRPMFGASAAPRSVMSSKVEKDMSRPGPGEYEIP